MVVVEGTTVVVVGAAVVVIVIAAIVFLRRVNHFTRHVCVITSHTFGHFMHFISFSSSLVLTTPKIGT